MATLAFDSLQFARRLKAVGVPEKQAELQAELMAEAFGFYVDNIVTRDYLDATLRASFAEQDVRWDKKLSERDARWDEKLAERDTRWERQLTERDVRWDKNFAEHGDRLNSLEQRVGQLDARLETGLTNLTAQFRTLAFMIGGTWLLVGLPLLQQILGR